MVVRTLEGPDGRFSDTDEVDLIELPRPLHSASPQGDGMSVKGRVLTITVVDVGDGACTILRPGSLLEFPSCDPNSDLTVIDCGTYLASPDHACNRLMAVLGGFFARVTTIVVTHFDADHYLGLMRLAELMETRGQSFDAVQLIAPRPPDGAETYVR